MLNFSSQFLLSLVPPLILSSLLSPQSGSSSDPPLSPLSYLLSLVPPLTLSSLLSPISSVWFKVKLHVKDTKTVVDKKKYVAFWLERYAVREPGMQLTVVFDMCESGLGNIVSPPARLD